MDRHMFLGHLLMHFGLLMSPIVTMHIGAELVMVLHSLSPSVENGEDIQFVVFRILLAVAQ